MYFSLQNCIALLTDLCGSVFQSFFCVIQAIKNNPDTSSQLVQQWDSLNMYGWIRASDKVSFHLCDGCMNVVHWHFRETHTDIHYVLCVMVC